MTGNNAQILMIGFAFLSSASGIFLDIIVSRKRISNLHRGIEICEKAIYDYVNGALKVIISHYKKEVNRILDIPIREISALINTLGKKKKMDEFNFNIRSFEVNDLDLDFTGAYKKIRQTNTFIKKLEIAAARIKIFRWIFGVILTLVLLVGFIFILLPKIVPAWITVATLVISILSFIVFLFDSIRANDLIDNMEKEYGISMGE